MTMKSEDETSTTSVYDYIRAELRRGYLLQNDEQRFKERREKFYNFFKIPFKLEKFIFFGLALSIDAFLLIFTILPFRFILALLLILTRSLRNLWRLCTSKSSYITILNPAEICDILKVILIVSSVMVIWHLDSSYIYHLIKSQSVIKLYIFFNMLEVADKMFSSFGQDVLETLYWSATEQNQSFIRIIFHLMLAIFYVCVHSFFTLLQACTLNVAINSKNGSLLTVMMSNNFVELKSMVFKKFEKSNLFHMSCSDVRERFHYLALIMIVTIQTMDEYNWSEEYFGELMSSCCAVFFTEILVDWFKHSFVNRFNEIPANAYEDYSLSLAYDLVGSKLKTAYSDHMDVISRRMGLIPLPMSVLIIRIFSSSFNFYSLYTILCFILLFICLATFKFTINIALLGFSISLIDERREIEERANKKSASLPVSRHNSVSDLTILDPAPSDEHTEASLLKNSKPTPIAASVSPAATGVTPVAPLLTRSNSLGTRSTPHSPSMSTHASLENITEHLQNSFDSSLVLSDSTVSLVSMNDGQNIALPAGSFSERKPRKERSDSFNNKLKKKLRQKFPFSGLGFRRRISLQHDLPDHGESQSLADSRSSSRTLTRLSNHDDDTAPFDEQDENRPPPDLLETGSSSSFNESKLI